MTEKKKRTRRFARICQTCGATYETSRRLGKYCSSICCSIGRAPMRTKTADQLIAEKIEMIPISGCWIWMGACDKDGYGFLSNDSRMMRAHRFFYESKVKSIPPGLTIDHTCRVRCCVNPSHLEPVTIKVNTLRGTSAGAINAAKTHCIHGHELSGANLYIRKDGRGCRACNALSARKYKERIKEKAA